MLKTYLAVTAVAIALYGTPAVARAQEAAGSSALIPAGAWADVLKGGHPRLFGPKAHLEERRQAYPQYYEMMKTNDSIIAAGIVNALDGMDKAKIDAFVEKARANVAKGVTNEHQDTWLRITEVAQTYDFFFDAISADDRRAMIEWLNGHLDAYKEDEGCFHNSTLSKVLCYLRVAYATWGDNPRAKDFRDYALVRLYEGRLLPVLNELGAGGGFTECGWYSRHSLWHMVEALELARRFEGYDGFAKSRRFFYDRLAYEMLQPYPGLWTYGAQRYPCEGDGSLVYGGHNEYPRHMRTVLAQYFRGSELARYTAAAGRQASNSASKIVDFLYIETPDEPLDLGTFPTAHIATGIGKVYARSDWTDDASWMRFECGDYYVGHQHFEVGNLEIFRYEPLATESGEYVDYGSNHAVNWLLRTIAHNCILVYEPGETWTQLRDGGRNKYANDGGQTKKWEWTVGTLGEWMERRDTFERGDIIAYENRPEYMYVAGDCTAAYAPSKLESWVRQVVFIRPHAFVVFDRVVTTSPDYAKTWVLHSRLSPEMKNDSFTVKDGKGELFVEVLLPEKAGMSAVEGNTYGGQTFDEAPSAQTPVAAKWRVELRPPVPQKEDVFLTVFSTDGPLAARLIRDGAKTGAVIGNAQVTFEGKTGGVLRIGQAQFALEAKVKTGRFEE